MTDAIDASSASPNPYLDTQPLNLYATQTPTATSHPFSFTGNAAEYFGIWIVNLLLNIITLGIYSPWAKVRKKRYFYGNTWLAESNFEYHGDPLRILKGRIIAVIALALYSVVGYLSPKLGQVAFLALALVAPWFIVRSLKFNARNSSYRQIRFHFVASSRELLMAVWVFYLIPLVGVLAPDFDSENPKFDPATMAWLFIPLVLGVFLYPYLMAVVQRLHINKSLYGATPFSISATVGKFYRTYLFAYLSIFGVIMLLGIIAAVLIPAMKRFPLIGMLAVIAGFIGYFILLAFIAGFMRSRVSNLIFNATMLGTEAKFISTLSARKLTSLYFFNILGISLTFGLLVPWAAVRSAKYRASCLALVTPHGFDAFVSTASGDVSAVGEEVGEFFDMDFSL